MWLWRVFSLPKIVTFWLFRSQQFHENAKYGVSAQQFRDNGQVNTGNTEGCLRARPATTEEAERFERWGRNVKSFFNPLSLNRTFR